MRTLIAFLTIAGAAASPATAEVLTSSPTHFEVDRRVTVPTSPADAYEAVGSIGEWWDPAHSYSGEGSNLTLQLRAGGCFCEALPGNGGSVEHARVIFAQPGATLRLQGGLGPLQSQAVVGTWTLSFKAVPGGTEIRQNYLVAGHMGGRGEGFASPVDQVMATQLTRLQQHIIRKKGSAAAK